MLPLCNNTLSLVSSGAGGYDFVITLLEDVIASVPVAEVVAVLGRGIGKRTQAGSMDREACS